MDKRKSRLRWRPQISLKWLLIVWSVGGVCLTLVAHHYRQHAAEQEAIANIRERTTSFQINDYHEIAKAPTTVGKTGPIVFLR